MYIAENGETHLLKGKWLVPKEQQNKVVHNISFDSLLEQRSNHNRNGVVRGLQVEGDKTIVRLCWGPSYENGHFCYVKPGKQ
jgi:hypothetical protein